MAGDAGERFDEAFYKPLCSGNHEHGRSERRFFMRRYYYHRRLIAQLMDEPR